MKISKIEPGLAPRTVTHTRAACLTVIEFGGGESSTVFDRLDEISEAQTTVVQQVDEHPADLAQRAIRRVEQLASHGMTLFLGAIVASDDVREETFEARCQIALAMIRAMRGSKEAKLVIAAPAELSAEGRHQLLAIAGTLASQLGGLPVEVSVRFEERRPTQSSTRLRAIVPVRPMLPAGDVEDVGVA